MTPETLLQSKVPPAFSGQTLLDYLCVRFPYQNRETWEGLIHRGKVRVNGQKPSPLQVVHKGNLVSYAAALKEPDVAGEVGVLHEEETFLAASKDGYLPCHADGQFITRTFIHLLKVKKAAEGYDGFLGLAHRIDRETSGILLVAKTPDALRNLSGQFERGEVEKVYLAWVRGDSMPDRFELNNPIGRDPESTVSIRRKALPPLSPDAQEALTRFEVLERKDGRAFLKCLPQTGRTHQIRAHLEAAGYPVVGDKLYGRTDKEFLEFVWLSKKGGKTDWTAMFGAPRQMLHASSLTFAHPVTGQKITYEAPLPKDML